LKIALDYDGTMTKDFPFWEEFIELAKGMGHEVAIVTKRYEEETIKKDFNVPVYYMCRINKIFCEFKPDIWIDNNPFDITGYPS